MNLSNQKIALLLLFAIALILILSQLFITFLNHSFITKQPVATSKPTPRLWTIISTQCSPFQDWSTIVAVRSHERLQIPGNIVRLMACNDADYKAPTSSYEKYSLVRLHDYDDDHPDDPFPPRNKACSLRDWLHEADLDDDDVIILMDPDQIFISHVSIPAVGKGRGMAAGYSLSPSFLKTAEKLCENECSQPHDDMEPYLYGAPYILTVADAKQLAPRWARLTELMRLDPDIKDGFGWLTEMYSYIMIAMRLGIVHDKLPLMISNAEDDLEPWNLTRWYSQHRQPLSFIHYCQTYRVGSTSWSKHSYHDLDVRTCRQDQLFPDLNEQDQVILTSIRGRSLVAHNIISNDDIIKARSAWLYENVVQFANYALKGWYEEFCT